MSDKKRFLLRLDGEVYDALERWAAQELRSVNGQIEFVLREALFRTGRLPKANQLPQNSQASQVEEDAQDSNEDVRGP